jgi:hypothetical protein
MRCGSRWGLGGSDDGASISPEGARRTEEASTQRQLTTIPQPRGRPDRSSPQGDPLAIVFKVIRRCDKELGSGIVKVTRMSPGVRQEASRRMTQWSFGRARELINSALRTIRPCCSPA